jgi:hypothetical protein
LKLGGEAAIKQFESGGGLDQVEKLQYANNQGVAAEATKLLKEFWETENEIKGTQ